MSRSLADDARSSSHSFLAFSDAIAGVLVTRMHACRPVDADQRMREPLLLLAVGALLEEVRNQFGSALTPHGGQRQCRPEP